MNQRTKKYYLGPAGIHYPYKATAICQDGRIRMVFLNQEPDTFFSHPGRCKIKGKSMRGYLTVKEDGEFYFIAYIKKNAVTDFELVKYGFDPSGSFPGIGTQGTRFGKVVCGVGTTMVASFVAALDLIEQVERCKHPTIDFSAVEEQAGELGQLEADGSEDGKGAGNVWFYYGIRYNLAA